MLFAWNGSCLEESGLTARETRQTEGFAHRWERARSPPATLPLRPLDADFFDLLRYFLRCYAVGLPHRYAWHAATASWHRFAGEDRWRLWPDD